MCVSACARVTEQAGGKQRGEGEWLALERGGGCLEESSSSWKKQSLGKRGRGRDREEEHEGERRSGGGGWENALAGCNRLQAVPGPQFARNLAAPTQPPDPRVTHDQHQKKQTHHHGLHT